MEEGLRGLPAGGPRNPEARAEGPYQLVSTLALWALGGAEWRTLKPAGWGVSRPWEEGLV